MAVFKSKYRELSFYVDGELLSFAGGSFSTNDKKVIAVLETLKDVKQVEEPVLTISNWDNGKSGNKPGQPKQEPKAEEPKKEFKRRPSAK